MSLINFQKNGIEFRVEISGRINDILNQQELPLTFVVQDWLSGDTIYKAELVSGWWATFENSSFKNFSIFTKSGILLKELIFDPNKDAGDIEEFFNLWIKTRPRTKGLVLGAGSGRWGEWVLPVVQNNCFAVLVEGDPHNQEILKKTHKNRKNVKIENSVVSTSDGKVDFWIAPDIEGAESHMVSSLNKSIVEKFLPDKKIESITVESLSINSIIDKYFNDDLDWIRIDVEGSDYDVIMAIRPEVLSRLKMLVYENMNISTDHVSEINNKLRDHGFGKFLDFGIDTVCIRE